MPYTRYPIVRVEGPPVKYQINEFISGCLNDPPVLIQILNPIIFPCHIQFSCYINSDLYSRFGFNQFKLDPGFSAGVNSCEAE